MRKQDTKVAAETFRAISAEQDEAKRIEQHLKSPTLMMLVLVAVIGSFLYASFLFNPANRGDILPYTLVVVAETFLLLQAFLTLWTILASGYKTRTFAFHQAQANLMVPRLDITPAAKRKGIARALHLNRKSVGVDVFITTYGEDLQVIRKTALIARDIIGKHTTTILDDGKSDDVMALAAELNVGYIRRADNKGAKAGNINHALEHTSGDFFVILDADFVPDPYFLYETLPFFENESIAFVQTPQHYDNLETVISKGAGYMQHVFYSLIQPGKNRFNAAFCVGTNVVFRRSAVESIGGIYQDSKSEDIWTSILLHEQGYQSVYIPNVLAIGKTPDTVKAYTKQQLRWATGAFEILFTHNPLRRKVNLTVDQRLQYFGTTTYYFTGIASLFLILLPPLQIFFNLTPVNLHIPFATWALYYSGFYVMQILVAFYTMGGFRLQTLLLANASFPIYVRAFWNALTRREQDWHVTGRVGQADSPFNYIVPQVLFFVFLLGTSIVGVWKARYTHELSLSLFWNAVNTMVLGSFVYIAYQEGRGHKRAVRQQQKLLTKHEVQTT